MLGMAPGMGNPTHPLLRSPNYASVPLILSTCATLTSELGPKMSLTYWEEREEKNKLRTEAQDGTGKCQLLLARSFVTVF